MRRDDAHIVDILRAAQRAVDGLAGMELQAFIDDWRAQSIVLHQLLILGEAVKRLSPQFRESHPEMPWRSIAGQRDVIVHQYDDVDVPSVWAVVTKELPGLIKFMESVAPREEGESTSRS